MRRWIIIVVLMLGESYAGSPQGARGYPADLFAMIAPMAITTTNANGYNLISGGRMIEATRRDNSWVFTDSRTREVITAHPDTAGWQITRGKQTGRAYRTITGAKMNIGPERRMTTATRDGYVTTTSSTTSAEAFFEHRYRRR